MTNVRAVASRYAQALSAAEPELASLDTIRKELRLLASAVEASAELRRVLSNPVIDPASKGRVMQALLARREPHPRTVKFIAVLAARDRLIALREIAAAVDRAYNRRAQVHDVEITSAAPLDEALKTRLSQALERVAGGRIALSERVDPELLGGVVARIGETIYDASLRSRLERLRSQMVGASASR